MAVKVAKVPAPGKRGGKRAWQSGSCTGPPSGRGALPYISTGCGKPAVAVRERVDAS
jgi:hypothetical protein